MFVSSRALLYVCVGRGAHALSPCYGPDTLTGHQLP